MSNRKKTTQSQQQNINIADLPMCPELIDHCGTQMVQVLIEDEHDQARVHTPQPIFQKPKNKHNKNKDDVGFQMCSKYNYCFEKGQSGQQAKETDFSFPSLLMEEQCPIDIQVRPVKVIHVVDQMDKVIESNLKKHKKSQKIKKKEEQLEREAKKKKLDDLMEKAKEKMRNCPKKKIGDEKRIKWGHGLYNQEKYKEEDQNNKNVGDRDQSKQKKIILKPVNQRIQEYKDKQKQLNQKLEQEVECQHQHQNPQKPIAQKQLDIQKNAQEIIKQRRKERQQSEEKKKCIQGKIRAIQLQSKENLKRCGKKPVDPTIQFVVEIPQKTNHKKPIKKKVQKVKQPQQDPHHRQKNFLKRDMSRSSLSNTKKSHTSKRNTQNQGKQMMTENVENVKEQNEFDKHPYGDKFYVWNIPITSQDLNVFELGGERREEKKRNGKSFREEVDEFLSNKFHVKMEQENKKMKMNKFEELVKEKKKQLVEQFDRQQYEGDIRNEFNQVFWNQDMLFKNHQIANFAHH